jgi:hypothetical protein
MAVSVMATCRTDGLRPSYYPLGQARTGRGIHGLPKVSPSPAMPKHYMPCGAGRPAGGGRVVAVFFPLDTPSRTGLPLDTTCHTGLLFKDDKFGQITSRRTPLHGMMIGRIGH